MRGARHDPGVGEERILLNRIEADVGLLFAKYFFSDGADLAVLEPNGKSSQFLLFHLRPVPPPQAASRFGEIKFLGLLVVQADVEGEIAPRQRREPFEHK